MNDSSFRGDRMAAERRLQKLTGEALLDLSTEHLNLMSFHLAAYLDVHVANGPVNTKRMREELNREHRRDPEATAWTN